jgi:hypothetical protein
MPVVVPGIKMWSRQTSDATVNDDFKGYQVTFSEAYQIQTTPDTTEIEVYVDGGLPGAGTTFPGFPFVYAQKAALQRISPIYWIATVNYTGQIGGVDKNGNTTSPLNVPPQFTWDDVESEEEINEDFDGMAIANTAGERVRGVKALFADQTLNVSRNFLSFSPYLQAVYRRSVNSDNFLGWPPGTCKLMKLSATNVFDQNIGYYRVTATFQFRYPYNTTPEKAWYARFPSMGLKQLDTDGNLVACVDDNDLPVSTPAYLDEDGRQTDSDGVFFKEIKLYGSLPYNALGFF